MCNKLHRQCVIMNLTRASKDALQACLLVSVMSTEQAGCCTGATGYFTRNLTSALGCIVPEAYCTPKAPRLCSSDNTHMHLHAYKECTARASARTARTFSAGSSRNKSALNVSAEACRHVEAHEVIVTSSTAKSCAKGMQHRERRQFGVMKSSLARTVWGTVSMRSL